MNRRLFHLLLGAAWLILASGPLLLGADAPSAATKPAVGSDGVARGISIGPAKPQPLPATAHRLALCIGIDNYLPDSGYPKLSCACNDARSLGEVFTALGYETTVMTDDAAAELVPTADNLEREIRDFARTAKNPDDEVVVSYSGHGDIVDDQAALVPLDYDEHHPNLVTVSDVLERLNDKMCLARNKLLLLDACHAAKENTGRFLMSFAHERSLLVISACDSGQNSYEDTALHHGRFTQVLIWGLVGAGFHPPATRPADADSELQWHGEAYPPGAEFLSATQLSEYIGGVFKKNNWATAVGRGQSTAEPNSGGQNPRMFGDEDVTAPMIVARQKVVQPPPLTDEDRQSMTEILQKAETAYLADQFVPMMHHATTALRIQDNNADALALRALGNLRSTYTGPAEEDARAATKIDARQAIAWQVLGMCESGKGDDAAALEDLLTANRLIAQDAEKWHLVTSGEDAARRYLKIADLSSDDKDKFAYYKQAAQTQNCSKETFGEAANWMGFSYDLARGVPQDYVQALSWYRKGADAGNATAMDNIGYMYELGHAVPQDYHEAMAWYHKAADAGSTEALNNVGALYDDGHGVPQDYHEAMIWYRKGADADVADSMDNIGFMYAHGHGVAQDYVQARTWYQKAADEGSATAINNIGALYDGGHGVAQDYGQAMKWYQKGAAAGSGEAMYNIGDLYAYGHGVPQDYSQAIDWYRKAVAAGCNDAMNNLAAMYEYGQGVSQNYTLAMNWYRKAADAGDATAMGNIGYLYAHGKGVKQDYAQALSWYRKGADAGDIGSMNSMGLLYDDGKGVKQDYGQAMNWYRKAADAGVAVAMDNIGGLYENGHGVPQSDAQAISWFTKAAEAGSDSGMCDLGYIFEHGRGVPQDYKQAMSWYRKAAEKENLDALESIADLYAQGHGVPQDYSQAMIWYRKAADAGNIDAMNEVGYGYMLGRGVGKDDDQAISWYQKSAASGNSDAMNNLAYMFEKGKGVSQDFRQAMIWYRKAADGGNASAMENIGYMYENGEGMPADLATARTWYQRAADGGDDDAKQWIADHGSKGATTRKSG